MYADDMGVELQTMLDIWYSRRVERVGIMAWMSGVNRLDIDLGWCGSFF